MVSGLGIFASFRLPALFQLIYKLLVDLRLDDEVIIRNCPKLSARKSFKLEKIIRSPEREREAHLAKLATEGVPDSTLSHLLRKDATSNNASASA
jgi:hypothetical protein